MVLIFFYCSKKKQSTVSFCPVAGQVFQNSVCLTVKFHFSLVTVCRHSSLLVVSFHSGLLAVSFYLLVRVLDKIKMYCRIKSILKNLSDCQISTCTCNHSKIKHFSLFTVKYYLIVDSLTSKYIWPFCSLSSLSVHANISTDMYFMDWGGGGGGGGGACKYSILSADIFLLTTEALNESICSTAHVVIVLTKSCSLKCLHLQLFMSKTRLQLQGNTPSP